MTNLTSNRSKDQSSISKYSDVGFESLIKIKTDSSKINFTPSKIEPGINIFDSDSNKFGTDSIFVSIQNNNSIHQKHPNLEFRNRLSKEFIKILQEEHFEYGITSKSELFIKEKLNVDLLFTKNWLNSIFAENFHQSEVILGILRVISRINQADINPEGQIMAIACFSHKSIEVKEAAIRIFENWGNEISLKTLKNISISPVWLQEYVESIVSDLESDLCQN